jgi:uncharacterized membrane protein
MAFVDILAFEEVTILIGAVLMGFIGFSAYLGLRRNDPASVKSALRGGAIPVASVGAIATVFGVWGEMVWQYPGPYLLSYNILFNDVYLLFGVTLLVVAVSMGLNLKLQYAGLLGFIAGGVTIAYGYQGYYLGLTKEPLDMFLLYGSFGLAAILAFPSTILVDHFLARADGVKAVFGTGVSLARRTPSIHVSTRAAGQVVPTVGVEAADETTAPVRFRLPYFVSITAIVFVVAMALAAIAALYFLDSTLPAHLASAP